MPKKVTGPIEKGDTVKFERPGRRAERFVVMGFETGKNGREIVQCLDTRHMRRYFYIEEVSLVKKHTRTA